MTPSVPLEFSAALKLTCFSARSRFQKDNFYPYQPDPPSLLGLGYDVSCKRLYFDQFF